MRLVCDAYLNQDEAEVLAAGRLSRFAVADNFGDVLRTVDLWNRKKEYTWNVRLHISNHHNNNDFNNTNISRVAINWQLERSYHRVSSLVRITLNIQISD